MPLDRFVLIIVCVIAAAGVTIWAVASLIAAASLSVWAVLPVLLVLGLAGYVVLRVIADRVGNAEDDHYDGIEK